MRITTVTCDRCGYECEQQTWKGAAVDIVVSDGFNSSYLAHSNEWCIQCLREFRLWRSSQAVPTDKPAPTFEETIRALVREEIEVAQ